MKDGDLEVGQLQSLLRRPATDVAVLELIREPSSIERAADQGYVELKRMGISVMFKEARVVPSAEGLSSRELVVAAFHLHRRKHDGYAQYVGRLPGGVVFGDPEADVVRKMGEPVARGGGGISTVTHRPIPQWMRYSLNDSTYQIQLDVNGRVEMVTIYPSEVGEGRSTAKL